MEGFIRIKILNFPVLIEICFQESRVAFNFLVLLAYYQENLNDFVFKLGKPLALYLRNVLDIVRNTFAILFNSAPKSNN